MLKVRWLFLPPSLVDEMGQCGVAVTVAWDVLICKRLGVLAPCLLEFADNRSVSAL